MKDYLEHPSVAAIYLGGSAAEGRSDKNSDTDIYVLTTGPVELEWRKDFVARRNPFRASIAPGHFGDGDAWADSTGTYDVMFWNLNDTLNNLRRVVVDHQAANGYTTAFWHTIRTWHEVGRKDDHSGLVDELARLAAMPYPGELADAIVNRNRVLLRGTMFSLEEQLVLASNRNDTVSINHRTAAIVASWFDIVFAVNRQTHPGEKRLLDRMTDLESLPDHARTELESFLEAGPNEAPATCHTLIDSLENWLDA